MMNALAACWRVFYLCLLVLFGLLLVLYAYLPSAKQAQGEVEQILRHELQASSLDLGTVSWSWGWHLAVRCQHVSFAKKEWGFSIQDSDVKVDMGLWQWLHGSFSPLQVRVHGGHVLLRWDAQEQADTTASRHADMPVIPVQVRDVQVHWVSGTLSGDVALQALDVVPALRELRWHTDAIHGVLHWNKAMQMQTLEGDISLPAALPPAWRTWVRGTSTAHVQATRSLHDGQATWLADWQWQGNPAARLDLADGDFVVPFRDVHGVLQVDLGRDGALKRWVLKPVHWQWKDNQAQASVSWEDHQVHLKASATQVSMPLLWRWLSPIDDAKDWKVWLRRMHQGIAQDVHVDVALPWAQWNQLPSKQAREKLQFHVEGDVSGADISLGSQGMLRQSRGHVVVDEQGLQATVHHTQLPHDAGVVHGNLAIDWQRSVMQVDGSGVGDVQALLQWSGAPHEDLLHWYGKVPASSKFSLRWGLGNTALSALHVQLQPKNLWKLRLYAHDVQVQKGSFDWDMKQGLHAQGVVFHDAMMHGLVDFSVLFGDKTWKLQTVQGRVYGGMQPWVQAYALPVESASGEWKADVQMQHGDWSGTVDLADVAWENFLGMPKTLGEPLLLRAAASGSLEHGILRYVQSTSPILQVDMTGHVDKQKLDVDVTQLKNPYVDVALQAVVPLGQGAWKAEVHGTYLHSRALPNHRILDSGAAKQPWQLKADIAHVQWGVKDIRGVHIDVPLNKSEVIKVHADTLHIQDMALQDVRAAVHLLDDGSMDIPQISAHIGKNQCWASLQLNPNPTGGMQWRGVVHASGLLGSWADTLGLSQRLRSGHMQALFAGWGVLGRTQPWWQGLHGRFRLHAQDGEILQGGTLTKLLAALSWADLPKLLIGFRPDLTREGLVYDDVMVEGYVHDGALQIPEFSLHSSAFRLVGTGSLSLQDTQMDVMAVVQPFQNVDAVLGTIPVLGYVLGGQAGSIFRRAYHIHGPFADAEVDKVSPEDAGARNSGLIDRFFNFPNTLFGGRKAKPKVQP